MELSEVQKARLTHRIESRYSNFDEVVLPELPDIPGQISLGERRYLFWLLSEGYTGAGDVVEVGTWLGLSTIHLAAGLRDSGNPGRLYSFDNFIWGGQTNNKKSGMNLEPSSDFLPYFEENIKPLREHIEVFKGDFTDIRWDNDHPIDILFLDGPKTAEALSICLTEFSPALIPGQTMVVFQDYQHPASYETPLAVQNLGKKLNLCHAVESGGTMGFLLTDELTPEDTAFENLSVVGKATPQIKELWERLLVPVQGRVLERLKSGYALHLCELGETDEAISILRSVTFDKRLHKGWTDWSAISKMYEKYQPLFDVYLEELQVVDF